MIPTDEDDPDGNLDEANTIRLSSKSIDLAVVMVGSIGSAAHVVLLSPTLVTQFFLDNDISKMVPTMDRPLTTSSALFLLLIPLSYLGRWTFDLASTQLS